MNVTRWGGAAVWTGAVATVAVAVWSRAQLRAARAALHRAGAVEAAARESVDIALAAYLREDRPTFDVAIGERQAEALLLSMKMLTGPPEVTVDPRWTTTSTGVGDGGARRTERLTGSGARRPLVPNDHFEVLTVVPAWAEETTVTVDLRCVDTADGRRNWSVPLVLDWTDPAAGADRPWPTADEQFGVDPLDGGDPSTRG